MMLRVTRNQTISAHFKFMHKLVYLSRDQVTWKAETKVILAIADKYSVRSFKNLHDESNNANIEAIKRSIVKT
jgi:hypothetical protein